MDDSLPDLCKAVLKKIYGDDLKKYAVTVEGRGNAGEGYSNEMLYLHLNGERVDVHLVVKMMLDFTAESFRYLLTQAYDHEIEFYEHVWPAMDKFQKDHGSINLFDKIPKYYGSLVDSNKRVLVMENLKASNFVLRNKDRQYDRRLVELVFQSFGQFHGLSLALKHKNRAEFDRVTRSIAHSWDNFRDSEMTTVMFSKVSNIILESLSDEIREKARSFLGNIVHEYRDTSTYKGNSHVVVHGDCWINNFLFKHNDQDEPIDLRCLDFQMPQVATPVYDLSYWFYSGATKDLLDDLDYYLHFYHKSMSAKLQEFGIDIDEVYPLALFKDEWRRYSKFGFTMSMTIWRLKTSLDTVEFKDVNEENWPFDGVKCDEVKFAEVMGDLVAHMVNNGFI